MTFYFSEGNQRDDPHYNEPGEEGNKKKKKKNKKQSNEEEQQAMSSPNTQKNFNPFIDIKDHYGGQKTCMVILPRFPSNHRLASTQRLVLHSKLTFLPLSLQIDRSDFKGLSSVFIERIFKFIALGEMLIS